MTPIPPILYLSRKLDDPDAGIAAGRTLLSAVERCIKDEQAALAYDAAMENSFLGSEADRLGVSVEELEYETEPDPVNTANLDKLYLLQALIRWFITPAGKSEGR